MGSASPLPYQASDKKMVDEEETFKKFGYYSTDLSPKSNKKICAACDNCGKVRDIKKQCYRALCSSCSRKGILTGTKNPAWKGGKIKCICKVCGVTFEVYPVLIKRGGGKFCSSFCVHEFQRGKNHSNWKGGLSFGKYCPKFNNKFKHYIRTKFDNVCFLCGKTEEENGEKLSIHHVNYQKSCGCAETEEDRKTDNNECQFVPLYRSCNSKVNKDRDKWERYFKNKLRNKLNGWYI